MARRLAGEKKKGAAPSGAAPFPAPGAAGIVSSLYNFPGCIFVAGVEFTFSVCYNGLWGRPAEGRAPWGGKGKMQLNIAVAEDEADAVESLRAHVERYERESGTECRMDVFPDGLAFLEKYRPQYDAVFMDIEMPHMNGMEAAKRMRSFDPDVPLVFITNLKQYAIKGYEVQALDFLVKPIRYDAFASMMRRVEAYRSRDTREEIVLQNSKGMYRVAVSDIYYLEVERHYIVYHTASGDIQLWGSLTEEEKRLPSKQFARCNSCYLVNMQYVDRVDGNDVHVGKDVLPMSRGKKPEFLQALLTYISGR